MKFEEGDLIICKDEDSGETFEAIFVDYQRNNGMATIEEDGDVCEILVSQIIGKKSN